MGDSSMVVPTRDFTRAEFLEWVKVWLREQGLPVTDLVSAPLEELSETHPHADLLKTLADKFPAEAAGPEG